MKKKQKNLKNRERENKRKEVEENEKKKDNNKPKEKNEKRQNLFFLCFWFFSLCWFLTFFSKMKKQKKWELL